MSIRVPPWFPLLPALLLLASKAPAAEAVQGVCRCEDTLKRLTDPDPQVNKLLARYNFPADPFPWRLELIEQTPLYAAHHLTFPSPAPTSVPQNATVHAEYYLPPHPVGKSPAVLVLHILDDQFLLERTICRYFATNGTPALLMMMPFYGPRRPPHEDLADYFAAAPHRFFDAIRAAVLEDRRAACWLQQRPEVDPARIGLVGISLGAITGGLVLGVDPRFKRNVLVLGGGDPAGIVWHANETDEIRHRLELLGYTLDRLRDAMADIDSLRFAKRVDPKTVLFINARNDETVPRDNTLRLWEAMGKPPIQWLEAGHYSASLYLPLVLPLTHHFVQHGLPPAK